MIRICREGLIKVPLGAPLGLRTRTTEWQAQFVTVEAKLQKALQAAELDAAHRFKEDMATIQVTQYHCIQTFI